LPGISTDEAEDWTKYDWANMQSPGALESYRLILANMNVGETRLRYNTQRRLPMIGAKTLVVWGTHDEVNAIELGEKTAEFIPDARLVTFDCGHMVPHERPSELNEVLLEFLN
jgi:pimeloyl-ACP methyl ester carboxylesterase